MKIVDAKFVRDHKALSSRIDVTFESGEADSIYESIVEHCCKDYSLNELKDIRHRLYCYLRDVGNDDTPLVFREMYGQLLATVDKRQARKE